MIYFNSYNIEVWCGLRDSSTGKLHTMSEVTRICNDFMSRMKVSVSITPKEFNYNNMNNSGVMIEFKTCIESSKLEKKMLDYAKILCMMLREPLGQEKLWIKTSDQTYTLE